MRRGTSEVVDGMQASLPPQSPFYTLGSPRGPLCKHPLSKRACSFVPAVPCSRHPRRHGRAKGG